MQDLYAAMPNRSIMYVMGAQITDTPDGINYCIITITKLEAARGHAVAYGKEAGEWHMYLSGDNKLSGIWIDNLDVCIVANATGQYIVRKVAPGFAIMCINYLLPSITAWQTINLTKMTFRLADDFVTDVVPQGANTPVRIMVYGDGRVAISTLTNTIGNTWIRCVIPIVLA